jgi:hypothetical protein
MWSNDAYKFFFAVNYIFSSVLSSGNPKISICLFSLCRIEEEAKQTQSGIVTMFERLKV